MNKEFVIIYKDGTVFETDDESIAISKLDSDDDILTALRKEWNDYVIVFVSSISMNKIW